MGNVSVYPAHYPQDLGSTWIVANVGVHPDFRGRGIARMLMQASMQLIQEREGKRVILQVDTDNQMAIRLYESLGFYQEKAWTLWKRPASIRLPETTEYPALYICHPRRSEWRAEWLLAQRLRQRGGLGWLRPLHITAFKRPLWRLWVDWLNLRTNEHLIIRTPDEQGLLASAWIESGLMNSTNSRCSSRQKIMTNAQNHYCIPSSNALGEIASHSNIPPMTTTASIG